ncbi:class A beta-lactamase [Nocardioides sp. Root151]|uniref:class A beta-lactamase n=1 Tax=Nocardioides sp. Root151 TaxID=1736475 RepID=UPI000702FAEC|nr:class A beta-lactamase [Nocardioides sp. Root151]KQZ75988.1 hypothetical protein ASD66_06760 [Nocardioides sp. Root151]
MSASKPSALNPSAPNPPHRRTLLKAGAVAPFALAASGWLPASGAAPATTAGRGDRVSEVAAIERRYDVTVGLSATHLRSGRTMQHRADAPAAMCSVFKALAAAAVLRDHDRRGETLDRRVFYPPADVLISHTPETGRHVDDGMTIRELCDAALRFSDNAAGNLLLREIGGPRGLTAFLRSVGDGVSRLDRWETELNSALPGDPRDTTTPAAIARTYAGLLIGDTLSRRDRTTLRDWMLANQTSDNRFRAGLPEGWILADKTGGGDYGSNNDVGVAWNPRGEPVVIAALVRGKVADAVTPDVVHAELAALVADRLGSSGS